MPTTRKAPWAGPPPAPGSGGHGLTGGGGQQGPGPSSGGSAWPSPCPSRVHTVDAFSRCSVTAGLLTCPSQRSRRCGSPGCLLLPQSVAPMPQFLPSWRTEPCRGCPRGAVCGVPGHRLFCSQILAMTGRTVCLGHCRGPCPLSRLWAGLPLTLTLLSLIPAAPRPPPGRQSRTRGAGGMHPWAADTPAPAASVSGAWSARGDRAVRAAPSVNGRGRVPRKLHLQKQAVGRSAGRGPTPGPLGFQLPKEFAARPGAPAAPGWGARRSGWARLGTGALSAGSGRCPGSRDGCVVFHNGFCTFIADFCSLFFFLCHE